MLYTRGASLSYLPGKNLSDYYFLPDNKSVMNMVQGLASSTSGIP